LIIRKYRLISESNSLSMKSSVSVIRNPLHTRSSLRLCELVTLYIIGTNRTAHLHFLPTRSLSPHVPKSPSFLYSSQGGFADQRQEDGEWFGEQLGAATLRSIIERRSLSNLFNSMNLIDGRYLLLDEEFRRHIGSGSFGTVDVVTYRRPGLPGNNLPPFF